MLTGYNNEVIRRHAILHVQTEDKGRRYGVIDTLVYKGGRIVYHEKSTYSPDEPDEVLKEKIKKQHESVIESIKKGDLDDKIFEEDTKYIKKKTLIKKSKERELDEDIISLLNEDEELKDKKVGAELMGYSIHDVNIYFKLKLFNIENNLPIKGEKLKIILSGRKKEVIKTVITTTDNSGIVEIKDKLDEPLKIYWLQISIKGHLEGEIYIG